MDDKYKQFLEDVEEIYKSGKTPANSYFTFNQHDNNLVTGCCPVGAAYFKERNTTHFNVNHVISIVEAKYNLETDNLYGIINGFDNQYNGYKKESEAYNEGFKVGEALAIKYLNQKSEAHAIATN